MAFAYITTPLPAQWPGTPTPSYKRRKSPFDANWGGTLDLLAREVSMLRGRDVHLAIAVPATAIRRDGGVRADARIREPGVILSFKVGPDKLSFPCDTFTYWQDNVRAIALALEALRKVDRYGVRQGRQYEGFKALPSQSAVATPADDIAFLSEVSGLRVTRETFRDVARTARARTHPDAGGDVDRFQQVQAALSRVELVLGVTL